METFQCGILNFINTNIAIYLLDGDRSLADILHNKRLYLSFITQLELLDYCIKLPDCIVAATSIYMDTLYLHQINILIK